MSNKKKIIDARREIVKKFQVRKIGYDAMGYKIVHPREIIDLHHVVVSHSESIVLGDPYEGYSIGNVVPLTDTAHKILHNIEVIDPSIYGKIFNCLCSQAKKVKIDPEDIKNIRSNLIKYESKYRNNKEKMVLSIRRDLWHPM